MVSPYFSKNCRCVNTVTFVVFALFLVLETSCGRSPAQQLNDQISIALREQNDINKDEWDSLIRFVDIHSVFLPQLLDSAKNADPVRLTARINEIAGQRRNRDAPTIFDPFSKPPAIIAPKINFYLENSGSMDGYVSGLTSFKDSLFNLLSNLSIVYGPKSLKLYYINSRPIPDSTGISQFIKYLTPASFAMRGGDRSSSDLDNIFSMIFSRSDTNTLNILVSDFICSIKGINTSALLSTQRASTKLIFANSLDGISVLILKMKSQFNGKYYYWDPGLRSENVRYLPPGSTRPYYVWIFGPDALVADLLMKPGFNHLAGFRDYYFLSAATKTKTPYYTVLKLTGKVGEFMAADRQESDVRSIENIQYKDGKLQFTIAADLSNVPVEPAYLTDRNNYRVSGNFRIESILPVSRNALSQNDWVTLENGKANYLITVSTTSQYPLQDLKIDLLHHTPSWVEQSNTIESMDTSGDKTFGIKYLIEGVSDAYSMKCPAQSTYFPSMVVKIRKEGISRARLPGILFGLLAVAVLTFAMLAIIKRKNNHQRYE